MTEQKNNRFIAARKKYIESQFLNLNPEQRKAVMATEGPLLLLAGAGSGKTTVLVNRVANLMRFGRGSDTAEIPYSVSDEDVSLLESAMQQNAEVDIFRADALCAVEPPNPWEILVITFTNKAANELKERLANMLGPAAQDVWAMTFHSACCRILRREIEVLGYSSSFTIYDQADSERIMKGIIKDMGLDDKTFPAKYVLNIISREKDKMVTPEQMQLNMELANDYRMEHVVKAYKSYQKKLKENNALDFDDIILKTVELLQNHDEIRKFYQMKFRYVLVDEYQDTNHMQYMLTSLLAGGHENICVVGDDDQSIYRFRGATVENILDFEKQYPSSRTIRLEQNYRSTQTILNVANAVIAHNLGRKGKRLWTENGVGDPVTVYEASDESVEANYIAEQLKNRSSNSRLSDYAILYRTNAQSNAIEFALKLNRINYQVVGGHRFFERAEIKDMLAYMCVINNRADDLRLRRIINNPPRGIGAKTVEVAERLAVAEGKGLYSVISDPGAYGPLQKSEGKLNQFTAIIEDLAKMLDEGSDLPEFYDALMERTGYSTMLQSKPTEENQTRLENIRELKSSIYTYVKNVEIPTLAGFLEEVSLYTDIEEYDEGDDAVVLMTMHSAKGLEFPNVFVVGFEDGLFPGMRAIGDINELEEERRLCYVAITRAKKTLTISHARQRMLYGKTNAAMPSRFLREMPQDLLLKKGVYVQNNSYAQRNPWQTALNPHKPASSIGSFSSMQPKAASIDFRKGDMVQHAVFGKGMVIAVVPMGGDALLEVVFDEIGTKKLMAKTASAHLKRL